ncbi:MAG: apolipoprotein N-acyltransferase [Sulfurovum sp.]|nr:apolipoprotein N-acyltransferase [Sulfurovum sp.]
MYKIRYYFTTFELTRGLTVALLASAFIYLQYYGLTYPLLNTLCGILAFYLLLNASAKIWFVSGAFIGLFWFYWIALSLIHYKMLWAVPLEILLLMLMYGTLFGTIAKISHKLPPPYSLILKALGLLSLSYIHPFGFDWFKPELVFIDSYIGITKWQFALVLLAIVLRFWQKNITYLLLILFAYQSPQTNNTTIPPNIALISTYTSVQDKWDTQLHTAQFEAIFTDIDHAIDSNKSLIIFPESIIPLFLNRYPALLDRLQAKAQDISIVIGALYWDGDSPKNSSYIFTKNQIQIASKVILVPFGESNPLPDFLSDWVNKVFYDGSIDYQASTQVIDYQIDGITYRNAICFEATSEKLYEGNPQNMIVISNNGWFTPSIEPTLQKLLLRYYHQKYGTNIYHAINMSQSYVIL